MLKQSLSLVGLAAFLATTPAFAILGGDQGAGNGGDMLVTQNPDNASNDPNTITVSPDQDNGVGYFRLVGEPGKGQYPNYALYRCEVNPDGVGPLVSSCASYTLSTNNNSGDSVSALALNASVALPPGYYIVAYAGTNYWFKLQANQRIETPLTKILYPQTLHNAGFSLRLGADYTDLYTRSALLKSMWGAQFDADVQPITNSIPLETSCMSTRSSPEISPNGASKIFIDPCVSSTVPMAKENYHNLHDQDLVQFTGVASANIATYLVNGEDSRYPNDSFYKPAYGLYALDRTDSLPSSWLEMESPGDYDQDQWFFNVQAMSPESVQINDVEAQSFNEGEFYSILPGTYNAYATQANGDWIKDEQGNMKVIQHLVVPDRTTSQGAALDVEPLDWLTAAPKQTPSKSSCFLFFCG